MGSGKPLASPKLDVFLGITHDVAGETDRSVSVVGIDRELRPAVGRERAAEFEVQFAGIRGEIDGHCVGHQRAADEVEGHRRQHHRAGALDPQPVLAGGCAAVHFRAPDVAEVLERVCGGVGYPASIRVDQGSEFISRDLDLWAYTHGVTLDFSRAGKPTDNAFIESFNGKFRAECLNQHWFMSLDDAVRKCEAWRRDYNKVRPHSAIGNKTPISLVNRLVAHGPPLPADAG